MRRSGLRDAEDRVLDATGADDAAVGWYRSSPVSECSTMRMYWVHPPGLAILDRRRDKRVDLLDEPGAVRRERRAVAGANTIGRRAT
jgi:hypothetical protein